VYSTLSIRSSSSAPNFVPVASPTGRQWRWCSSFECTGPAVTDVDAVVCPQGGLEGGEHRQPQRDRRPRPLEPPPLLIEGATSLLLTPS
jgi:hypothetical protein